MLKRFTTYLLLISMLSSHFSRVFVCAGFELNRNYIEHKLCINRTRPQLHCNGRCYFMRKLQEAEKNEKKREKENLEKSEITFFAETAEAFSVKLSITPITIATFPVYCALYKSRFTGAIFIPPRRES